MAPPARRSAILDAACQGRPDEIIKANTLPKDTFEGSDRGAITAAITKAWLGSNPHSPPLKVILWSDWGRFKKSVWSDASGGWVKQDYSNLGASVVVKSKDGRHAYWFDVTAQKDHLNGDQLGAVVMPNENAEVPAERTVLIGAVK